MRKEICTKNVLLEVPETLNLNQKEIEIIDRNKYFSKHFILKDYYQTMFRMILDKLVGLIYNMYEF